MHLFSLCTLQHISHPSPSSLFVCFCYRQVCYKFHAQLLFSASKFSLSCIVSESAGLKIFAQLLPFCLFVPHFLTGLIRHLILLQLLFLVKLINTCGDHNGVMRTEKAPSKPLPLILLFHRPIGGIAQLCLVAESIVWFQLFFLMDRPLQHGAPVPSMQWRPASMYTQCFRLLFFANLRAASHFL